MASKTNGFRRQRRDQSFGTQQEHPYANAVSMVSPKPPEECSGAVSSSGKYGGKNFPREAAEPVQHNQRKCHYHYCMYEDLRKHNYKRKFSELVKCEQKTHQDILQIKCSGKCTLVVEELEQSPNEDNSDAAYKLYGSLTGLSDDQIAYVSQSADRKEGVVIMARDRENEVCRAAILQRNYSHTDVKLFIGFDESNKTKVLSRFKVELKQKGSVPVHVKFDLKNSYFYSLSQAISRISPAVIAKVMPDAQTSCTFDQQELEKYLPKGSLSSDQLQALQMVVSTSPSGPPCLITGPFGTGKSHLLASAAYWLFRKSKDTKKSTRILVCTQQRESADNFFFLYRDLMSKDEDATAFIVRDYGYHNPKLKRMYKSVKDFKEYIMKKSFVPDSEDFENFLVIMPCLTALNVHKAGFLPHDFFTHIFIDEGAQMREPEAIAPLLMSSELTKVVIAGDTWQVGPSMLVLGREAQKYGLATSLLERLLVTYQSDKTLRKLISVLNCCHRCHEDILNLSARLFYETDLRTPENEPPMVNPKKFPFPLIFVCSSVNEGETSTTTTNSEEAKVMLEYAEYVAANWSKRSWGDQYHLHMCAMSPTRTQLTVLLKLIKSGKYASKLIEVRRVPTYFVQGKEYKVLLLSTSEPMTEYGASANPTKSLCNPYVFNTAITRAQSLVVSFGNPFLLLKMEANVIKHPGYEQIGKCWSTYFKSCLENGTMQIAGSLNISEERQERIFLKIKDLAEKHLKETIQYPVQMPVQEETESQTTVTVFAETPPSAINPRASTTDVEYTTIKPLSTETQTSEILDEGRCSQELQMPSETEAPKVEPPSPSTPTCEFDTMYDFKGRLGGGGFGVVFRVKYTFDGHDYALKVIPLPEEGTKRDKLLREVRALASFDHPHIVRYSHSWPERAPENWPDKTGWQDMKKLFVSFAKRSSSSSSTAAQTNKTSQTPGVSVTDSVVSFRHSPQLTGVEDIPLLNASSGMNRSHQNPSPSQVSSLATSSNPSSDTLLLNMLCQSPPTCLFIRMELCKEETLKDLLAKCNKESTRRKKDMFDYFEQMLSALSYIHGKGYIHRDLKPSNIFFSREEERLKIGDFGLVTTGITNDLMGLYPEKRPRYACTPIYASPEQLEGKTCCQKADIYTLGLICFELHYICKTSMERMRVFEALKSDSIKFPSEFPKRIYKEVPNLIKMMLLKEAITRPSAEEILATDDFKELKKKVNRKRVTKQPYIPVY